MLGLKGLMTSLCTIYTILNNAPHKNYGKLHCSVALAISHINIFDFKNTGADGFKNIMFQYKEYAICIKSMLGNVRAQLISSLLSLG